MTYTIKITHELLHEIFNYDPSTGLFVWRTHASRPDLVGRIAGSPHSQGYIAIAIKNRKYLAHRLAWTYVTGHPPDGHIDHKDGDKTNNRFENLRIVTRFGNLQNMRCPTKANTSGFLGVSAHQGKWIMQIMTNGVKIRQSGFDTPEEAHDAYLKAKRKLHETCTI